MKHPLVSVIVPTYNQEQFLDETLTSVLQQRYPNWECIVVNDGSTDATAIIANKWAARDPRFKPLHLKNSGVSNARNQGIAIAAGHYILPLDGDDRFGDDYIGKLVEVMQSDPELKLVYGSSVKFGVVNEKWELPKYSFESIIVSNMIHCSGLYRKSDFILVTGGYDVNMHEGLEDWEFWINFLKDGGKVERVDHAVYHYRVSEQSRMTGITLERRYRLLAYIYHKHPELYAHFINDPSLLVKIDFPYSFYLSALTYSPSDQDQITRLRNYYLQKLKSLLATKGFFRKKKLICQWYLRGKLNFTLWDVLIR